MDTIYSIIETIRKLLVFGFPSAILILFFLKKSPVYKESSVRVLSWIRWFIIIYSIVNIIYFLISLGIEPDKLAVTNRAKGPYKLWSYIMFCCATLLPFSLLHKTLGRHTLFLFVIAFLIQIGRYFEQFVIIVTSIHRDYYPTLASDYSLVISFIINEVLQGVALVVIGLILSKIIKVKPH